MVKRRFLLIAMVLLSALAACAPAPPGTPASTPTVLPGETSPPVLAATPTSNVDLETSPTPEPMRGITPAVVLEPATPLPSPTAEPPPVGLPLERLSILHPGPGSQVSGAFRVIGYGGPSWNERVRLRLYGEDGRLLDEKITYLLAYPGNAGRFAAELDFSVRGVAEAGRLEVVTFSRRNRRPSHLATLDLVLLGVGQPRIFPALYGPEKLAILSPREAAVVEGGVLPVYGGGWTDSDLPLHIELFDLAQNLLGAVEVPLVSPGPGQTGVFQAEIPYQIPYSRWARIVVTEVDEDGRPLHMNSRVVWLRP